MRAIRALFERLLVENLPRTRPAIGIRQRGLGSRTIDGKSQASGGFVAA